MWVKSNGPLDAAGAESIAQAAGLAASKPAGVPGERALLAQLRRNAGLHADRLGSAGILRLGIGDDCAILRPLARDEIVVTTDLFLENIHFRRDWHQPQVAGHRCLARGLSDLAAMGATPAAAFLSLALPVELAGDWARRFLDGLLRLARLHQVPLAGGDTAQASASQGTNPDKAGALFAGDIVLLGSVKRGKALLRSGARVGDAIYVTGALGGAAAELRLLESAPAEYARKRRAGRGHPHLFPQPRVAVGRFLLGRASAAIDLSDGLSTDLAHVCEESGVGAEVEASLVPVHRLARRGVGDSLALALHGGEDYELLFTARAGRRLPAEIAGVPIRRIGQIVAVRGGVPPMVLVGADGSRKPLQNQGWEHFSDSK